MIRQLVDHVPWDVVNELPDHILITELVESDTLYQPESAVVGRVQPQSVVVT